MLLLVKVLFILLVVVFCMENIFQKLFFFLLFRATPEAYGGSQVMGQTGAVAASLHHSSQQHQIFNPLREARDRTTSWFLDLLLLCHDGNS